MLFTMEKSKADFGIGNALPNQLSIFEGTCWNFRESQNNFYDPKWQKESNIVEEAAYIGGRVINELAVWIIIVAKVW